MELISDEKIKKNAEIATFFSLDTIPGHRRARHMGVDPGNLNWGGGQQDRRTNFQRLRNSHPCGQLVYLSYD